MFYSKDNMGFTMSPARTKAEKGLTPPFGSCHTKSILTPGPATVNDDFPGPKDRPKDRASRTTKGLILEPF